MIGEVQYGGRVTDDYDKVLLNTFAKVWFGDGMFADNFQFYKGPFYNHITCFICLSGELRYLYCFDSETDINVFWLKQFLIVSH